MTHLSESDSRLLAEAADKIIAWCRANRRPLPWREDASPYHVWISEIMLQQTRIETVIPYYHRFLKAFPTVEALANAPEEQILKLWEGLGYYSRARRLKTAATKIISEHGGTLPRSAADLRKIPGIGQYTAGAIASIAYGEPEPAVDGNVLRVLARLLAYEEDVMQPAVRKTAASALKSIYPSGPDAALLTEGLMELGEIICLPNGTPLCENCPLASICLACRKGCAAALPLRSAAKERRIEEKTVLILCLGKLRAVHKRKETGLLAGLWELPNLPGTLTENDIIILLQKEGLKNFRLEPLGKAKHIFTHIEWHMNGWKLCLSERAASAETEAQTAAALDSVLPGLVWLDAAAIRENCAVPSAFRAYMKAL